MIKDGTYEDCKEVFDSLTRKEQVWMGGHYNNVEYCTIYKKVAYDGNKPVGFIDLYDCAKMSWGSNGMYDPSCANINIAVRSDYRGQGIARALLENGIEWFKSNECHKEILLYLAHYDNDASNALAIKCGFAKTDEPYYKGKDDNKYVILK